MHALKVRCWNINENCAWNVFNVRKGKLKCENAVSFPRLKLCLSYHWIGDESDVILNQNQKSTTDMALIV